MISVAMGVSDQKNKRMKILSAKTDAYPNFR